MARLAIVTGASSGIGEAYAERLAADRWDLVVVARRLERLEQLAERLHGAHGVNVQPLEADLSDPSGQERVAAKIADAPVELLVNNAGLAHYMPFTELAAEPARELLEVNVSAVVRLSQAAVPGMVERGAGSIINVASLLAFSAAAEAPFLPQRAMYAATKSFVVTFSRRLAAELRDTGVQVQVVCPGVVRSEFHTRQGMDLSQLPRMEPADVVRASLADLAGGTVMSIPGLDDPEAIAELDSAGGRLLAASRVQELPERYAGTPSQ